MLHSDVAQYSSNQICHLCLRCLKKLRKTRELLFLPHLLQFKMKEKFDHSEFEAIKAQASMHKLSLHDTLKEKTLLGDLTYYGYLTQNQ